MLPPPEQHQHCRGISTTPALAWPRHQHCWSQSTMCMTRSQDSHHFLISQLLINKPHNPLDPCGDAAPHGWIEQDQGLLGSTNPPRSSYWREGLPPAHSPSRGSRSFKAGTFPNSRAAGSENNRTGFTHRAILTWTGQRRRFFNQQPGTGRGQWWQLKHEQPSGTVCARTAQSGPRTAPFHHSPQQSPIEPTAAPPIRAKGPAASTGWFCSEEAEGDRCLWGGCREEKAKLLTAVQ